MRVRLSGASPTMSEVIWSGKHFLFMPSFATFSHYDALHYIFSLIWHYKAIRHQVFISFYHHFSLWRFFFVICTNSMWRAHRNDSSVAVEKEEFNANVFQRQEPTKWRRGKMFAWLYNFALLGLPSSRLGSHLWFVTGALNCRLIHIHSLLKEYP